MAGSYLTFGLDELRQKYAQAESPYNEFLRRRGMSVGPTSGAKSRLQPAARTAWPTRAPMVSVSSTSSMRPSTALPGNGEPDA